MSIETYGRYQLLKRLATGGMAQIYLARRQGPEGFEKLLVVKRILPHLAENDDFVKMFLDEARIAARLNHANVVQIFDLGAQDDSFFIAMEYIHGEDVRRLWKHSELRGQPLPVPLVCRILIEACAGLDYAHKRTDPGTGRPLGIVHRDVSPQNILVTFEGGVKVVDFGIAKAADQATVTRSGVLKGKYSYMSPEQAAGLRVDCRADIFALGVVLYELLTGTRLFKRPTDIQTLSAVSECRVLPPSHVTTRVPADLDAIVLKALAKDPAERFQEAVHLQLALEDWLTANRLPSSTAHLSAFMKELYAERLTEEARSGEVLVEDSESPAPPPSPRQDPASRRTGLRPALRTPSNTEDATAALRPRPPTRTGRLEPEPEPERPAPRQSGSRRGLEPAAGERPSRGGLGPVPVPTTPPRVEEDAPTLDGRAASRATLTDVKLGTEAPPVMDARAAPRVHPSTPNTGRFDPGPPHNALMVEDDAPTLAMPELARPSRVVVAVPQEHEAEEDAPTLSLGMSRPARKPAPVASPAPVAAEPAAPRRGGWFVGVGLLVAAVAVAALVWAWPKPSPATVRLETVPPGATVVLEGQTLKERTPLVLPPMEAGSYSVVVTREGYQELRTTVEVPVTGTASPGLLRLVPVAPKPVPAHVPAPAPRGETVAPERSGEAAASAPVRLRVETEPADAVVFVDGQRQGASPVVVSAQTGKDVAVRVEASKHQPLARTVKVGAGPEQVERFVLEPESRAAVPAGTSTRERAGRPESRSEARMARVRFAVQPWAEVTCGGKRLGETPFEAVELRVGTYDCRFFNPDLKKTLSRRIEVKPIDLNVVSVKFE